MRTALLVLALAALALAYVYYYPSYAEGWVKYETKLVAYFGPEWFVEKVGLWRGMPGPSASPWLPNGTVRETYYKRAMALFDVPEIDAKNDVRWYKLYFHDIFDIYNMWPVAVVYGLTAAVKAGDGPVFNASVRVEVNGRVYYFDWIPSYSTDWFGRPIVYYTSDPVNCPTCAKILTITVAYHYYYTGEEKLCIVWRWFSHQDFLKGRQEVAPQDECVDAPPPRNITILATGREVEVYVDGRLMKTFNATGLLFNGPYELFGMQSFATAFISTSYNAEALKPLGRAWLYIDNGTDIPGVVAWQPPKYASSHGLETLVVDKGGHPYAGQLQAAVEFDGVSVYVRPGASREAEIVENPEYDVLVFGRVVKLLRGSILKCQFGEGVAGGGVVPFERAYNVSLPGWYVVTGPGSFSCTKAPVTIVTKAGRYVVPADVNSTFVYTPPPEVVGDVKYHYGEIKLYVAGPVEVEASVSKVEYRVRVVYPWGFEDYWSDGVVEVPPRFVDLGNGTAYNASAVRAKGPAVVAANVTRLYLVAHTAAGWEEDQWVAEGAVVRPSPRFVDLGNGTALRLAPIAAIVKGRDVKLSFSPPVEVPVLGPVRVLYNATRLYRVVAETPLGANATWAVEGSLFNYTPPAFVDLGNGTAVSAPNSCTFVVSGPANCTVSYRQRLYWLVVEAPAWRYANWTPVGEVVRPPPVVDFGNGTRLVDPQPAFVAADGPKNVAVAYAREYWTKITALDKTVEGWRRAGSVVVLNATRVGDVFYTPVVPVVAVDGPINYTVVYNAYLRLEAKDLLGVPNPLTYARLCGRGAWASPAGVVELNVTTTKLCRVEQFASPISPYTVASTAVVAAVLLRRRRK